MNAWMKATKISKSISGIGKKTGNKPIATIITISPANIFAKSLNDSDRGLVTNSNISNNPIGVKNCFRYLNGPFLIIPEII